MRLLLGLLLWGCVLPVQAQPDPFPDIASAYRVEVDGRPVWEHEAHRRLAPASLTKLMTALLAVEQGDLNAATTVSRHAASATGSRLKLRAGERYRVNDLLAAALISSANDACRALAEHLGSSETAFVQRMNRRAAELGMRDTHFSNACGHDAPQHRSSARDLALLANEALKHPRLTELAARTQMHIETLGGARGHTLKNRNALIGRYRGAKGLKTGYTARAGTCLIGYAERDGHRVLLVLLHGRDRWWDAADILDLAFDHARVLR